MKREAALPNEVGYSSTRTFLLFSSTELKQEVILPLCHTLTKSAQCVKTGEKHEERTKKMHLLKRIKKKQHKKRNNSILALR